MGGIPEAIEHDRTGLLARDVDELARQTRRLVEDDALRERMGAAALERAQGFTWDRTAERTLAVLRSETQPAARWQPAPGPVARAGRAARRTHLSRP